MSKNYNYMLTILLFPFILMLSYLKLSNHVKGNLYTYLILIMIILFIPSFIMSLYNASEEILSSKKKWRIIPLILLSIFYLPIYYTRYVSHEEKYLGYILFIISIPLLYFTIGVCNKKLYVLFNNAYRSYIAVSEKYVYLSSDGLFYIDVDSSFRCDREDSGDYAVSCDRLEDDSFIGVYNYNVTNDSEEEIEEKMDFHLTQTLDYIEESGYTYEIYTDSSIIKIDYNENTILITQRNYLVDSNKYSLIIIKEMPKENISYEEYEKMIDSICFLNYNNGVSS